MNDRRLAVEAFRDECVWARSIRVHFAELFESGPSRSALLGEVANTFFHDLNLLLVEYILLQQCKLTDPAFSGVGKTNLTTNYLLTLDWTPATRSELEGLNEHLLAYRSKVVDARRKLIAHLDLKARLQTVGLGEVAEAEEAAFWEHLQAFVDAAHNEAVGGPYLLKADYRRTSVQALLQMSDDEARALMEQVRWGHLGENKQLCPKCGAIDTHYWCAKPRRWKCRGKICGHQFTVLQGTRLHGAKKTYQELLALLFEFVEGKDSVSARQLSGKYDTAYHTAYVMTMKVREAIADSMRAEPPLSGYVQADAAYFMKYVRPGNVGTVPARRGRPPKDAVRPQVPERPKRKYTRRSSLTPGAGKQPEPPLT